jgi:hypothetical protein
MLKILPDLIKMTPAGGYTCFGGQWIFFSLLLRIIQTTNKHDKNIYLPSPM